MMMVMAMMVVAMIAVCVAVVVIVIVAVFVMMDALLRARAARILAESRCVSFVRTSAVAGQLARESVRAFDCRAGGQLGSA